MSKSQVGFYYIAPVRCIIDNVLRTPTNTEKLHFPIDNPHYLRYYIFSNAKQYEVSQWKTDYCSS